MASAAGRVTSNRLLTRLSADDFALLEPHFKRVDLPLRQQLEIPRKAIDFVYFPESGSLLWSPGRPDTQSKSD
jgi:hypothetical protein